MVESFLLKWTKNTGKKMSKEQAKTANLERDDNCRNRLPYPDLP